VVEVEDVLDVLADDDIERESGGADAGLQSEMRIGLKGRVVWESEVGGLDDSVADFEESGLEDAGELPDIAGPVVLEKAGESAGTEDDGALLITGAEAVEKVLGERSDVFAALAQGWNSETDGSETKGEVGEEQPLAGHLAQRSFRRGENDGAAGRAILKRLEDAEEQALSGRGEEIDAVEVGEACKGSGISVGGEPLARVATLKLGATHGRTAEEVARESLLAGAVFAFNGGNLEMGRGHFSLQKQLAPGRADSDDVDGCGEGVTVRRGSGGQLDESEARVAGLRAKRTGVLHGIQGASRR
jgi:hypothetical protein